MEAYLKDSSKTEGIELLYFEHAEVEKFKNDSTIFAASGSLSVLFFSNYSRFVLQINDWRYPLVRRLPIVSEGQPGSPSYLLPAQNGFVYRLRLATGPCQGLSNFEAILQNNSKYSVKGEEVPLRKLEASPEDDLIRHPIKETGPKEIITQSLKQVGKKAHILTQNFKTGTKYLTSTKKRTNLGDIKNKDFKKEARSTFKKDFFLKSEKHSQTFLKLRSENVNQNQINEYHDLRTNRNPSLYISTEEIENLILNNKELAANESLSLSMSEQNKGLVDSIKQGLTDVKDSISNKISETSETSVSRSQARQVPLESQARGRNIGSIQGQPEPKVEGFSHYQG